MNLLKLIREKLSRNRDYSDKEPILVVSDFDPRNEEQRAKGDIIWISVQDLERKLNNLIEALGALPQQPPEGKRIINPDGTINQTYKDAQEAGLNTIKEFLKDIDPRLISGQPQGFLAVVALLLRQTTGLGSFEDRERRAREKAEKDIQQLIERFKGFKFGSNDRLFIKNLLRLHGLKNFCVTVLLGDLDLKEEDQLRSAETFIKKLLNDENFRSEVTDFLGKFILALNLNFLVFNCTESKKVVGMVLDLRFLYSLWYLGKHPDFEKFLEILRFPPPKNNWFDTAFRKPECPVTKLLAIELERKLR